MARVEAPVEGPPDPRLDARVVELLGARGARFAFNGLRRTLGAHPESLARALRRLERDGVVVRAEDGYALAPEVPPADPGRPTERRTVATIERPVGAADDEALGRLAGRWFGRLRWLGMYEPSDGPWLVWSVADAPGRVLLRISGRTLRVDVEGPGPGPIPATLDAAAYELLLHALPRLPAEAAPTVGSTVHLAARAPGAPVATGPN